MHTPLRHQLLDETLHILRAARPLVDAIGRKDRDLGSQLRRALSSVALNAAEGFGQDAGHARLRFATARGSLHEAQAALRVAAAWGYVADDAVEPVVAALHALGGRLFGLARR
jgi:four helix bundle protein